MSKSSDDLLRDLERLRDLRDAGMLSETEFEAQKARILGRPHKDPDSPLQSKLGRVPEDVKQSGSEPGVSPGISDTDTSIPEPEVISSSEPDNSATQALGPKVSRHWSKWRVLLAVACIALLVGGAVILLGGSSKHVGPASDTSAASVRSQLSNNPSPYSFAPVSCQMNTNGAATHTCFQGSHQVVGPPSGQDPSANCTWVAKGESAAGGEQLYNCRGASGTGLTPRQQAIETVRSQGYIPISMKGYTSQNELRVIVATKQQAADAALNAFFFLGPHYLGTDASTISPDVSFNFARGSTIGLNYGLFNSQDAQCCPSAGSVTIRFHWNGQRLVPLDPIPTDNANVNGSRR